MFLAWLGHDLIPGKDDNAAILEAMRLVTKSHAVEFRDQMMLVDKYAAATINRKISHLASLFQAMLDEGIIARNPFKIKRPKMSRDGTTPALTTEHAEMILAQPD